MHQTNPIIRQAGFTLSELMIVLVMIAVILGLAVPTMRQFILNQRIRNAAFEMSSALLLARSEATKRNADVVISQSGAGWHDGWTITTTDPGGVVLTIMTRDRIADINVVASHASVTFRHTGRLAAGLGLPNFNLNVVPAYAGVSPRCLSVDLGGKVTNEC